jgi:hypothetical protein
MYRPLDADLSQGDIIDDVPHLRLRPGFEVVRQITGRGNRPLWAPFPYPPEEDKTPDAKVPGKTIILPPFHVKEGEYIPVLSQFTRGVVVNYDCDLQHEEDTCLIALVRPLAGVHEEDRPTIRENRNYNYFYLPADAEFGFNEEAYVDFRRVSCLDPDVLGRIGTRRASLTALAVEALQAQFIRFVTRRDLVTPQPAKP